jgi:hypothetical protein
VNDNLWKNPQGKRLISENARGQNESAEASLAER